MSRLKRWAFAMVVALAVGLSAGCDGVLLKDAVLSGFLDYVTGTMTELITAVSPVDDNL